MLLVLVASTEDVFVDTCVVPYVVGFHRLPWRLAPAHRPVRSRPCCSCASGLTLACGPGGMRRMRSRSRDRRI
eukprot:10872106-Heterocapsa_arctica.AAC.1